MLSSQMHKISQPEKLPSLSSYAENPYKDIYNSRVRAIIDQTLRQEETWKYHMSHECVCNLCICGRHLCKLHPVRYDMKVPRTMYKREYAKPYPIANCPVHPPNYNDKQKPVVKATMYNNEFPPKSSEHLQKATSINNLKTGGPLFGLTTYRYNFMPKQSPTIGYGPFNNGIFPTGAGNSFDTSYKKTFRGYQPSEVRQPLKPPSTRSQSLKFISSSSYQNDFQKPRQKDYNQLKNSRDRGVNLPIDNLPKLTTYRHDFLQFKPYPCPAETYLIKRSRLKI